MPFGKNEAYRDSCSKQKSASFSDWHSECIPAIRLRAVQAMILGNTI